MLGDGPHFPVAVLMEQAHPPELAPLIAGAYGLTDGERRVTELVAQGFSTNDIGQRLHLSMYTVQDHLKSIFDKTGAGSRGELVAVVIDSGFRQLDGATADHREFVVRCPTGRADAHRAWVLPDSNIAIFENRACPDADEVDHVVTNATVR